MKIKLIIFDLDGVLVDLCETHRIAFTSALKICYGLDISKEYHDKVLNGFPTIKKLEKLGIPNGQWAKISQVKQEQTVCALNELKPDFDLQKTIYNLFLDYRLFCCSNSINKTVDLALTKVGVISRFDGFIGSNDVHTSKPSPEMYFKAMAKIGFKIDETLIIEDSDVGKQAIINSGAWGLFIKDRSELTLDRIIGRIKEIENV